MKRLFYFILSILVIFYIACLCYLNIDPNVAGSAGVFLNSVAKYGGLVLVLAYASVNFFGNPLKIAFFVLLVLVTIFYIITLAVPGLFAGLIGGENGDSGALLRWINF